jgi:hypothetical protein
VKPLRHDPDHRERMAVERQRPADNGGILVESPRPEAMTQHDDGTRATLVALGLVEQSPCGRDGAERREVVGGHGTAENVPNLDVATRATEAHRLRKPRMSTRP